jgi:Flp pilus assembly protein TadG
MRWFVGRSGSGRRRERPTSLRADQIGAAAVEFAFIFPVFVLMISGMIEFGRAIWTNYALQTAMEDTGRYVIAHPGMTDAQIVSYAGSQLLINNAVVAVSRDTVSGVDFVSVSATYSFNPFVAFLPIGSFSLSGRSRVPLTAPS